MKSRLAPTPSGLLHEGNALNFILTWWFSRFHGGELLLRIDDSDQARVRDEYLIDIFKVIDWLGLDYDSGPSGVDDQKMVFSQALKKDYYFQELQYYLKGELFGCRCSRKDLVNSMSYPGTCSDKGFSFEKNSTCLRYKKKLSGEFNQMVLWRKSDEPAYQLVSVLEDRDNEITHIVRGEDLLGSSRFQRELFKDVSGGGFPRTFHHDLISNPIGEKFSKTHGDKSVIEKYKTRDSFFEKVLWPFLGDEHQGKTLEELKKTPPVANIFKEDF